MALVYLPVLGGVTGRFSRFITNISEGLRQGLPWVVRAAFVPVAMFVAFVGAMQFLNPSYLLGASAPTGFGGLVPGMLIFFLGAVLTSIALGAAEIRRTERRVRSQHQRTPFGYLIKFIAGNPVMPIVVIAGIAFLVANVFIYFGQNNNGVEFFVESEPEQAIVYVRARGNLSVDEKDEILRDVEDILLNHPGVESTIAFAGEGGLNQNTGGASAPLDTVAQAQIELIPWENRPVVSEEMRLLGILPFTETQVDPAFDGDVVLAELQEQLDQIPGIYTEILNLAQGPASGKPIHLRLKGDDLDVLNSAAGIARAQFEETPGLKDIEDSRPLPGIDWQINVDVEKAGRYGADVATVGAMVQLVTRGILLDTMRVDTSDEEIEIRVRLPENDRVLSTLDTLKVRTQDGLIPLSNFVTREPVAKLGRINREDQKRYLDVKSDFLPDLVVISGDDGETSAVVAAESAQAKEAEAAGRTVTPLTANERIAQITTWLDTRPFPAGIEWEWTGDQEEQEESGAFLSQAFAGALGLMFIILLAQFNSFYNAVLVLLAVILSTTGVLIGMLVMNQPFSIIMTGTGIVALAGIVVNNNIVLIDTYQEYSRYMPRIEAIVRTAEARIRPVLLTTITTMAGLAPMMFGLSLDFIGGGYTMESPTSLWWIQLATAVVWGLGVATVLTLLFTPSMLALRVWATQYMLALGDFLKRMSFGRASRAVRDFALKREARRIEAPEILWDEEPQTDPAAPGVAPLKAAE